MNSAPVLRWTCCFLGIFGFPQDGQAELPPKLRPWLAAPQNWHRDCNGPVVSLGEPGTFDDKHIFAPAVAVEDGRFRLWYSGSRGSVAERVFRLGLATSQDGCHFCKHAGNPVYEFGDGKHSILTPTLLRRGDGSPLREAGKLRMWFSSTWFQGRSNLHTLHEANSEDGIAWCETSPALLKNVYAPSVIKVGDRYRMWYVDLSREPWVIRHASSGDGRSWDVTPTPCVVLDQSWETNRLFYPAVLRVGDAYLMWYGSYWTARPNTTALGFAASVDGLTWHKHPENPVFRPEPARPWESHYVSSQSVLRLGDGSFRMWYASRKQPPFVNKYFALNTAVWIDAGRAQAN